MPIAKYDIYFSGTIMAGRDKDEVRGRIAALFKADAAQLERLFCGTAVKIKAGVDMDTAIRYRTSFRDAGALIDIKPAADPAPEAAQPAAASALSALPPNTGSLIDCAPQTAPAPLPDISGIGLSDPGSILDDTPPPAAADIDTSGLSAAPAGSGSLEDYQLRKAPVAIPDISGLTAAEPGTGTLADCYQEKAPARIPDISALKIVIPDEGAQQGGD